MYIFDGMALLPKALAATEAQNTMPLRDLVNSRVGTVTDICLEIKAQV